MLSERLEDLRAREADIVQLKEDLRQEKENHVDDVANLREINEKTKAHYKEENENLIKHYTEELDKMFKHYSAENGQVTQKSHDDMQALIEEHE